MKPSEVGHLTKENAAEAFDRVMKHPDSKKAMERLAFLNARVTELNGAHWWAEKMKENNFLAIHSIPKTEEEKKLRGEKLVELCELLDLARAGDRTAIRELDEIRKETVDLYIRARSDVASLYYNSVILAQAEQPCFVFTFRNEVNVKYTSEDGSPRTQKGVKSQQPVFFNLTPLMSDKFEYQLWDINLGTDVAAAILATVDIAWDLAAKVDSLANTLLKTLYGSFKTTGAKLSRTYTLGSHIVPGNLPTTNDLVLSDNTGSTNFRMAAIRAILKYCNSWGNVFGTPLMPTGIIRVPSIDATAIADEFNALTTSPANIVQTSVLTDYRSFVYYGKWTVVPDVTLDPADGMAYPVLNRPIGNVYSKPAFAREFVKTYEDENKEIRWQMQPIGFATPEPWRTFTCRVKYRN